jgi:ketosteroid isomerase-like protein
MSLWADEDEVVCVHPGGPRALGLAAIRTSFAQIFANGGIPVRPEQVSKLQWPGGAVHHLVERIDIDTPQGKQVVWVLATNVYVKGVRGWQVVAHHASPAAPGELALGSMGRDGPSALH